MAHRDTQITAPSETAPLLRPTQDVPIVTSPTVLPPDAEEQAAPIDTSGRNSSHDAEAQTTPIEDLRKYQGIPEARKNFRYSFPALLIGMFLAAMDQTLVATSWSKIGSELHALNNTSWIATTYSATLIACHPLYGRLSDMYGRKRCILTAYTLFGAGTLMCGYARNIGELAAARAIAGAGGGGMNSLVAMIVADVLSLRERPEYQVYLSLIWFAGASSGAPIGGIMADTLSWRWSFWIQLPVVVVAFIAVYLALDLPRPHRKDAQVDEEQAASLLSRLDTTGSVLLISTIGLILFTLDLGSNQSWTSTKTVLVGAIAVPMTLVFILFELFVARYPVLPLRLVLSRATVPVHIAGCMQLAALWSFDFFVPIYLISVHGWSIAEAATAAVPRTLGTLLGNVMAARYIKRTGKYYWFSLINRCLTAICYIIMLLAVVYLGKSADMVIVWAFAIGAIPGGASAAVSSTAILAVTAYTDQGIMLGSMYFFRSLGSVWGISGSATIVNTVLRKTLAASIDGRRADEIVDGVRKDLGYLDTLPARLAQIVVGCYAKAIASSFVLNVVMIVVACISCVFFIERPLDRPR